MANITDAELGVLWGKAQTMRVQEWVAEFRAALQGGYLTPEHIHTFNGRYCKVCGFDSDNYPDPPYTDKGAAQRAAGFTNVVTDAGQRMLRDKIASAPRCVVCEQPMVPRMDVEPDAHANAYGCANPRCRAYFR